MNNFDLREYLQNNLLLKEDIDVTNITQIRKFLISSGYKRAEVNRWINKFSRDLQRRGLVKDEDQLELLYRRWLNDETSYDNLQQGLKDLRTAQQDTAADTSGDTEVRTEPFDGNIVKVIEPKNPTTDEPIEITKEKIVLPFLKKIEGVLANIWNDDIKGFFQKDIKNITDKLFNSEERKAKHQAKEEEKAEKERRYKDLEDYEKNRMDFEEFRRVKSDSKYLKATDAPEDKIKATKAEYKKVLTDFMEENFVKRQLDDDALGSWRDAVNDINAPGIKSLVIKDASTKGLAGLHNTILIDGPVEKFLMTYDKYIDKGVFWYQDSNGDWVHNSNKLTSNFVSYMRAQQDIYGYGRSYEWDLELPEDIEFKDIERLEPEELDIPYDNIEPYQEPEDYDDEDDVADLFH